MIRNLNTCLKKKTWYIIVDSSLNFEEHIQTKVNKANAIMGLIRRSFPFLDCHLSKKLYVTFVRPYLEYAQAVWAPHLLKHINAIENVQKRATKLVDGLGDLDYTERLRQLELAAQLWNHLHVYDNATLSCHFQRQRANGRHEYQLVWNRPMDGIRGVQANSFYYRTINSWNHLPKNVVNAKTINSFKCQLDNAWANKAMKYNLQLQSDS